MAAAPCGGSGGGAGGPLCWLPAPTPSGVLVVHCLRLNVTKQGISSTKCSHTWPAVLPQGGDGRSDELDGGLSRHGHPLKALERIKVTSDLLRITDPQGPVQDLHRNDGIGALRKCIEDNEAVAMPSRRSSIKRDNRDMDMRERRQREEPVKLNAV